MKMHRRQFLRNLATGAATFGSLGTALSLFGARTAHAADVSGYKALVCVFLLGGMDNHDTLIPYDTLSFGSWAQIRAGLLAQYGGNRARTALLPLTPSNAGDFGGREFALPPEMPALHALFQQGDAALVGNVGPLLQPLDRAQFLAGAVPVPTRLFSHNDQQATWMSGFPEGATLGWGGLFADAALAGAANGAPEFSVITSGGNELFLTGQTAIPYQVDIDGANEIALLELFNGSPVEAPLRAHFRAEGFNRSHLLEQDMADALRTSFDANEAFNQARAAAPPLPGVFPSTGLGSQLQAVAETIALRNTLAMRRQVFIVAVGGFDTHSGQAGTLPLLHSQIDGAVSAFYQTMQGLGVGSDVTLFTASDFGRTLAINGDGTDHGWASHHFVVGGSVAGGQIYGAVPEAVLGHNQDAGGGRLIPSVAVEELAAPLGSWFGLNASEVAAALPRLAGFARPALTFV